MTPDACAMATLVAVRFDGRLGPRELASVGRHLTTCASCARLAADLDRIRRLAASRVAEPPLEHQRRRVALLRDAARIDEPPGRSRRATIAALSVVAFLVLATVWSLRPVAPVTLAGGALSSWSPSLPQAARVVASEGARFERRGTEGGELVLLESGSLEISVQRLLPGQRFVVRTHDAEVEVRGTRFTVGAEDGRLVAVDVHEGSVRVSARDATRLLDAGEAWRAAEQATALEAPSGAATARGTEVVAPKVSPRAASAPGGVGAASAPAPAPAPALPSGSSPTSGANDPSKAYREAIERVAQGDYGDAAERLRHFEEAHPGDPRAEDAAFLSVVALERAGRRADAADAARRYLSRFPNGFRRQEAAAIVARAGTALPAAP